MPDSNEKKTRSTDGAQEDLSIEEMLNNHPLKTAYGQWRPDFYPGVLVLREKDLAFFDYLVFDVGDPVLTSNYLNTERFPVIPLLISGLKTAFLSLLFQLESTSAILEKDNMGVQVFYTPQLKHPKLDPKDAWIRWSSANPRKQPFVEGINLTYKQGKNIRIAIGREKFSSWSFSRTPGYGFLEPIRSAIIEYNEWLSRFAVFHLYVIPGNFEMDDTDEVKLRSKLGKL
ncbi:MAG: hypothetical protein IJU76_08495 [Desulfovibrionaceae bacterium]|nr:hypothetical protein [Desulfovibrionaceae bacterium]